MSSGDKVAIEVVVRQGCACDQEIDPTLNVLRNNHVVRLC
jgi:hypothetical protein